MSIASKNHIDVLIIGAGAAGLMCAITAGQRGKRVLVLDHANKPGKKILMSGGGRCNFTNLSVTHENFISGNPNFCKSALSRYTPADFIALVKKHNIPFHEKTLGQLFCDNKSKDILQMLLAECEAASAVIQLETSITNITQHADKHFVVETNQGTWTASSLVIATGGLSIPTMGATPFGYQLAEQFGIPVLPTRAGLVPFTLHTQDKARLAPLPGISLEATVRCKKRQFREGLLFTHRGLSGPAILQISSYWQAGETITIDLLPDIDLLEHLTLAQTQQPTARLSAVLNQLLPKRLVATFLGESNKNNQLQLHPHKQLEKIAAQFQQWQIQPNSTEGYRTAEVTLGGVDCRAVSSKTFESNQVPGLYFIGEVLDVTGWLGGYNFQWAWASGFAAGCAT
ncbi:MAG: membrane protein [marine bacterium B5-7]|nr:MAG: membrane protein [marine bacterium B5-7]